ncbi:hypothetical protein CIB48_g7533 [Xylaria polymorpha]|nr:hypothetical protein CIB48_g7533 [Xylaria polymorpha]
MQADEIEQVVGLTSLLDWSKMQRDSMATMLSSPFDDVGGDVRPASAARNRDCDNDNDNDNDNGNNDNDDSNSNDSKIISTYKKRNALSKPDRAIPRRLANGRERCRWDPDTLFSPPTTDSFLGIQATSIGGATQQGPMLQSMPGHRLTRFRRHPEAKTL